MGKEVQLLNINYHKEKHGILHLFKKSSKTAARMMLPESDYMIVNRSKYILWFQNYKFH